VLFNNAAMATLIYQKTRDLRAVQLLLGHTKIESTVRYLGIEVDDALAIAEQIEGQKGMLRLRRRGAETSPRSSGSYLRNATRLAAFSLRGGFGLKQKPLLNKAEESMGG
jgi:hypothetical protein